MERKTSLAIVKKTKSVDGSKLAHNIAAQTVEKPVPISEPKPEVILEETMPRPKVMKKSPLKVASPDVVEPTTTSKPLLKKRQKSQSDLIKRQTRSSEADIEAYLPAAEPPVENKPKRGRKKKHVVSHVVTHKAISSVPPIVKRGPGRPKKKKRGFAKAYAEEEEKVQEQGISNEDAQKTEPEVPVKRGPGRPRKSDSILNSKGGNGVTKAHQRDKGQFNQKIRKRYKMMLARRPTRSIALTDIDSELLTEMTESKERKSIKKQDIETKPIRKRSAPTQERVKNLKPRSSLIQKTRTYHLKIKKPRYALKAKESSTVADEEDDTERESDTSPSPNSSRSNIKFPEKMPSKVGQGAEMTSLKSKIAAQQTPKPRMLKQKSQMSVDEDSQETHKPIPPLGQKTPLTGAQPKLTPKLAGVRKHAKHGTQTTQPETKKNTECKKAKERQEETMSIFDDAQEEALQVEAEKDAEQKVDLKMDDKTNMETERIDNQDKSVDDMKTESGDSQELKVESELVNIPKEEVVNSVNNLKTNIEEKTLHKVNVFEEMSQNRNDVQEAAVSSTDNSKEPIADRNIFTSIKQLTDTYQTNTEDAIKDSKLSLEIIIDNKKTCPTDSKEKDADSVQKLIEESKFEKKIAIDVEIVVPKAKEGLQKKLADTGSVESNRSKTTQSELPSTTIEKSDMTSHEDLLSDKQSEKKELINASHQIDVINDGGTSKDNVDKPSDPVADEKVTIKEKEPLCTNNTSIMDDQVLKEEDNRSEEIKAVDTSTTDSKEIDSGDAIPNTDNKGFESIEKDEASIENPAQIEQNMEDNEDTEDHVGLFDQNDSKIKEDTMELKVTKTDTNVAKNPDISLQSTYDCSNHESADTAVDAVDSVVDGASDESREQSVEPRGETTAAQQVHHLVKWRQRQQMKKRKQKKRTSSEGEKRRSFTKRRELDLLFDVDGPPSKMKKEGCKRFTVGEKKTILGERVTVETKREKKPAVKDDEEVELPEPHKPGEGKTGIKKKMTTRGKKNRYWYLFAKQDRKGSPLLSKPIDVQQTEFPDKPKKLFKPKKFKSQKFKSTKVFQSQLMQRLAQKIELKPQPQPEVEPKPEPKVPKLVLKLPPGSLPVIKHSPKQPKCKPCSVQLVDFMGCLNISKDSTEDQVFKDMVNKDENAEDLTQEQNKNIAEEKQEAVIEEQMDADSGDDTEILSADETDSDSDSDCNDKQKIAESFSLKFPQALPLNAVDPIKDTIDPSTSVKFQCLHCSYGCNARTVMCEHIYNHISIVPYSCGYCGNIFGTRSGVMVHTKRDHPGNAYKIIKNSEIDESKYFTSNIEPRYNKHIAEVNRKEYKCQNCCKLFTDFVSVERHVQVEHIGETRFSCPLCEVSFFQQRHALQQHISTWHKHSTLTVQMCDGFYILTKKEPQVARVQNIPHGGPQPKRQKARKSMAKPKVVKPIEVMPKKSTENQYILKVPTINSSAAKVQEADSALENAKKNQTSKTSVSPEYMCGEVSSTSDTEQLFHKCTLCEFLHADVHTIMAHLRQVHNVVLSYSCPLCTFRDSSEADTYIHIHSVHPDKSVIPVIQKPHQYITTVNKNTVDALKVSPDKPKPPPLTKDGKVDEPLDFSVRPTPLRPPPPLIPMGLLHNTRPHMMKPNINSREGVSPVPQLTRAPMRMADIRGMRPSVSPQIVRDSDSDSDDELAAEAFSVFNLQPPNLQQPANHFRRGPPNVFVVNNNSSQVPQKFVRTLNCPYCVYKCDNMEMLHGHILTHGPNVKWTCPYCPMPNQMTKSVVEKHINICHPGYAVTYIPFGVQQLPKQYT